MRPKMLSTPDENFIIKTFLKNLKLFECWKTAIFYIKIFISSKMSKELLLFCMFYFDRVSNMSTFLNTNYEHNFCFNKLNNILNITYWQSVSAS